jgi:peroxiredoxin family protein
MSDKNTEATGQTCASAAVATLPTDGARKDKVTMIVMSGDMDKLFGAFNIATGAAAMGKEVVMFFTFWGLRAIKRADARTGTTFFGKMFGLMYGGGIEKANPSHFSFGGIGRWMFKKMMGARGVTPLPQLRDLAVELGVRMYGCEMSMDVMEIPREAFVEGVRECVGVAFFLAEAAESQVTLFI